MNTKLFNLLNWSVGNSMPPVQMQIHLTNKCNLNCVFCPTKNMQEKLSKEEFSFKDWKSVIEEAIPLGVKEFHLCGGGEPFFYKRDTLKLMELIKKNNCYGEIFTNGTMLDKTDIKNIVDMGWDKVTFSLNSSDEKTDDSLRGKDAFKKTIKAIKQLAKHKGKNKQPMVSIHVVLCNKNYKDLKEIIKLASELECQEVFFNSLNIWSEKCKKFELDKDQITELKVEIKEAEELAEKLKIDTNIGKIRSFEKYEKDKLSNIYNKFFGFKDLPCFVPWYNISIFPNGDTRPCFLYGIEPDNIKNNSLKEIWEGEKFSEARNNFINNNVNEGCRNCNVYNMLDNKDIQRDIGEFSKLQTLWKKLKECNELIDSLNIELNHRTKDIESLQKEISKKQKEISKKQKEISKKQKEIDKFYSSKGYRYILGPLDNIYSKVKKKK